MSKQHKTDTERKQASSYDQARHAASDAAQRAAQGLEANPLGVVVGGLAVGALVGALIPRSDREKQLLAPAGRKLGESARAAIQAAREAGYAELDQRGLTRDAAKGQAKDVVKGLGQALSSAGTAAAGAARGKADEGSGATADQSQTA